MTALHSAPRSSKVNPREKTAARLLGSSARNSYAPELDIDWDAEPVEGMWHMQPERMSLYGTALWDSLTREQQVELSKHEVISVARVGLWFEILLMGMLASHAYNQDPASEHTQYALTEIGDETRHSVMFARWADKYGGKAYKPHPVVHHLGKVFRLVAPTGPSMWAATLVAEELLDRLQREGMADERTQPLSRMVARIHVVEEARHVRFAREELVRQMERAHGPLRGGPVLWFHQVFAAAAAALIADCIISPKVYEAVGLDAAEAHKAARRNPEFHRTKEWMAEKIVPFLDEVGMINPVARVIYRYAHLLP